MDPVIPSPAAKPHRLWSLDVLRGGCALAVFLCHWHLWSDFVPRGEFQRFVHVFGEKCYDAFITYTWPTGGDHPAVICFFVLSGFCIHYPFALRASTRQPQPGWQDYFRRRFLRIMPVFWAGCLLGLMLVIAEARHPSGSALLAANATASRADLVVRFTATSGLYPWEIFAGNSLLTTVSVELIMYALFPLIYYQAVRGRWLGFGLVFVGLQLTGVWLFLFQIVTPFWVFNSILMFGLFWYAGALAAHLYVEHRVQVRGIWFLASWLLFLGVKAAPHFNGITLLKQVAWALVCALGMLWALRFEERHPGSRDHRAVRVMRYFGRISYSLYAMHAPAMMLATWVLLSFTHVRDYFVQLDCTLTAAVAATLLTYYGVERIFYRPRI